MQNIFSSLPPIHLFAVNHSSNIRPETEVSAGPSSLFIPREVSEIQFASTYVFYTWQGSVKTVFVSKFLADADISRNETLNKKPKRALRPLHHYLPPISGFFLANFQQPPPTQSCQITEFWAKFLEFFVQILEFFSKSWSFF